MWQADHFQGKTKRPPTLQPEIWGWVTNATPDPDPPIPPGTEPTASESSAGPALSPPQWAPSSSGLHAHLGASAMLPFFLYFYNPPIKKKKQFSHLPPFPRQLRQGSGAPGVSVLWHSTPRSAARRVLSTGSKSAFPSEFVHAVLFCNGTRSPESTGFEAFLWTRLN